MYEHLKMVKGIGPLELLAKQLQRENHLQDATLSTSKFGRKVAIAVADEHQGKSLDEGDALICRWRVTITWEPGER